MDYHISIVRHTYLIHLDSFNQGLTRWPYSLDKIQRAILDQQQKSKYPQLWP
jgi:hypothetical protein